MLILCPVVVTLDSPGCMAMRRPYAGAPGIAGYSVVGSRIAGIGGVSDRRRRGLGSLLSADQIYQVARGAGFPPDTAVKMTAIALRESAGNSDAFNGVAPDLSYGLWQINMYGPLGPARLSRFGLASSSQLLDPSTNARAAYALWAGSDANLDANWYIDHGGTYTAQYQANLPAAIQAAADSGDLVASPDLTIPTSPAPFSFSSWVNSITPAGISPTLIGAGLFGVGLLVVNAALD